MELKAHELYKKIILSLSKVQLNREKLFSKYFQQVFWLTEID